MWDVSTLFIRVNNEDYVYDIVCYERYIRQLYGYFFKDFKDFLSDLHILQFVTVCLLVLGALCENVGIKKSVWQRRLECEFNDVPH